MARQRPPIGVILAGGEGRRIGGAKSMVRLSGRPLIAYPLEALTLALDEVAVIAKPDTALPSLPGVTIWIEPESPRHPLFGVAQALELAAGRPVVVCAGDLPFVTPELIDRLAHADPGPTPAVVAALDGEMQPLLGCYQPRAAQLLASAVAAPELPLRETVAAVGPRLLEVEDPDCLFDVDAPDDLLMAMAMIDRRRRVSAPIEP
jgi:molybdopterin-guanine dinucleotide biosynthesis protein A